MISYNGEMIQLFGGNPSGQNLTVIINSIVNSLLLRCSFYTIYPEKKFQDHTAFITYGDDVMGSVTESCPKFNHISYADYLAEHDMKFTMPDKESTPTEYMKEDDVDFLKRKCWYNPDLKAKVGLLSEDSIYKRLHAHLASKALTPATHSAVNIDSSLHDWFFYGREKYDEKRAQLIEIADKADIRGFCPGLLYTYDERVHEWRLKYDPSYSYVPELDGLLDA